MASIFLAGCSGYDGARLAEGAEDPVPVSDLPKSLQGNPDVVDAQAPVSETNDQQPSTGQPDTASGGGRWDIVDPPPSTGSGGTGGWQNLPLPTGGYTWEPPAQGEAEFPSDMFDLSSWRLEVPEGSGVDRIEWDDLRGYEKLPFFYLNAERNAVVFNAPVEVGTTEGSSYPRTELREMSGSSKAYWNPLSGTHTLEVTQRINVVPGEKPEVVAGQIHDDEDDVIMIRLEDDHLFIEATGDNWNTLDNNYKLGTWFTVKIEVSEGRVKVYYNDILKEDREVYCYRNETAGPYCYFKAGCYTQANTSNGTGRGEVEISALTVTHE